MGDYMESVSISPSMRMYAEDTKSGYQTVDGRIAELVQKGIEYEENATD